jgi:predicted MFS family arabinose efflux permease
MLFIVLQGMSVAVPLLSLAMHWPLPLVCLCALGFGVGAEISMVTWAVALTTRIPADRLARVSSYDAVGTTLAMPVGALAAGPLAAVIGVPATLYAAVALLLASSLCALASRDIRTIRVGAVASGGSATRGLAESADPAAGPAG